MSTWDQDDIWGLMRSAQMVMLTLMMLMLMIPILVMLMLITVKITRPDSERES
jgi:hypothetical protein